MHNRNAPPKPWCYHYSAIETVVLPISSFPRQDFPSDSSTTAAKFPVISRFSIQALTHHVLRELSRAAINSNMLSIRRLVHRWWQRPCVQYMNRYRPERAQVRHHPLHSRTSPTAFGVSWVDVAAAPRDAAHRTHTAYPSVRWPTRRCPAPASEDSVTSDTSPGLAATSHWWRCRDTPTRRETRGSKTATRNTERNVTTNKLHKCNKIQSQLNTWSYFNMCDRGLLSSSTA